MKKNGLVLSRTMLPLLVATSLWGCQPSPAELEREAIVAQRAEGRADFITACLAEKGVAASSVSIKMWGCNSCPSDDEDRDSFELVYRLGRAKSELVCEAKPEAKGTETCSFTEYAFRAKVEDALSGPVEDFIKNRVQKWTPPESEAPSGEAAHARACVAAARKAYPPVLPAQK